MQALRQYIKEASSHQHRGRLHGCKRPVVAFLPSSPLHLMTLAVLGELQGKLKHCNSNTHIVKKKIT